MMSFTETIPNSRPSSETGNPEMRFSRMIRCASRIFVPRETEMTVRFITSRTLNRCSSSMMITEPSPLGRVTCPA